MLRRLDHLVILVDDLDLAASDYERLGFAVTPGGQHADGLTHNALIPFRDGSYFELVAFLDPEDPTDNVWGWRGFLPREGLIDYCVASDDLGSDVRRLKSLGLGVDGPDDGGRRLPDGATVRWRSARIRQEGRLLPFLIEDLTPRGLRVPGGPAAEHPNGATGVFRLELSAPAVGEATALIVALVGTQDGANASIRLGPCALSPVAMEREDAVAPGPLAVELVGQARASQELDPLLAHGANIRLRSSRG
ncbi:MAG: VOC family protein [Actinomycetota bacterium]|nr:VOC family protein [Actinomycetota bacterium]